ncbi:MAG TPA: VTT domain-containing protein [Terriglobales bacterium]|jgi:membrane protein YqaA with SNARE-associated domain|nr:VTT domain-containing protein [Terriglobales bacterium]
MKAIKHILARYTSFLWAILKPLGPWGVLVAAVLDGAAFGLPIDLVVGGYVSQNHRQWLIYVLMAAAGSALGSLVIYAIGYAGGEELLRKRVSAERFAKLHDAFEKHPFWSLMFPAMLPPPTPFKAFVLAAAVAEMSISHFVLAIFLGRFVRFTALAALVIYLGPGAVGAVRIFFSHHFHWVVLIAIIGVVAWLIVRRRTSKRGRSGLPEHTKS